MLVKDSQKLLPHAIPEIEALAGMVLEIPPHGISLHPKSIDLLFETARSGKPILLFQPHLPVTSELGLSPYPVLAYLYPQTLASQLEPFFQELARRSHDTKNLPSAFTLIRSREPEEIVHYFADHYGKAAKPAFVRAIIGNTCNLKCVMCPYHGPDIKPTHTTDFFQGNRAMSWEMLVRLARDCGAFGTSVSVGSVEEPLLHPHITDFVRLCRQKGVPRVHLTTNGQLLNEARSLELLEAGLTSLDVSLDATDAETYRRIRGSDFGRVKANIDTFLHLRDRLKIPCSIRTSFIRNANIPPEAEAQFKREWLAEVDSVFFLNVAKYEETNMRIQGANERAKRMVHSYLLQMGGRWPCSFPFTEMAVLPDGRVYYCIETVFRLGFDGATESMGDYRYQNLQEIWQGEAFQRFRRDTLLHQLEHRRACRDCEMWRSQVVSHTQQDGFHVMETEVTKIYHKKSRS
ncbi:MAG: radical SAM protein [Cyanobacteria bacterium SBLK]|nr:radical SAM protein [Cyanobacteria bacterium SBLK]